LETRIEGAANADRGVVLIKISLMSIKLREVAIKSQKVSIKFWADFAKEIFQVKCSI
jgi:hypothetical protein